MKKEIRGKQRERNQGNDGEIDGGKESQAIISERP